MHLSRAQSRERLFRAGGGGKRRVAELVHDGPSARGGNLRGEFGAGRRSRDSGVLRHGEQRDARRQVRVGFPERTIGRRLIDAEHDVDRPVLERAFGIAARIDDGKLQAEAVRNGSSHVDVDANDLVARHAGERGAARVHANAQNAGFLNGRRLNLRGLRLGLVSGIGRAARHCERKNHGATNHHAKDSFPKTLRHRNLRLFLFMRFFRLT